MNSQNLGLRIKEQREKNKLSQKELAAKIGISTPALSNYEKGIKTPSVDNLIKLSVELNTTPNVLLQDYINSDDNELYYYKNVIDFVSEIKYMNIKDVSKTIDILKYK